MLCTVTFIKFKAFHYFRHLFKLFYLNVGLLILNICCCVILRIFTLLLGLSIVVSVVCCCCLPCNHCSHFLTWLVGRNFWLRSTHFREFHYLKLCNPAYFVIASLLFCCLLVYFLITSLLFSL